MSGGVDSSVAACLLHEQGYEVIGLFMRVGAESGESDGPIVADRHRGCCSAVDAADARFVAGLLDIPFYALNFQEDFDRIIDYFAGEYANGRTPNPCVVCNHDLKFGKLADYADAVGAGYIATGHYARIEQFQGQLRLRRGVDSKKDQSYVLFGIERTMLDRMLLPIGGMSKAEVREHARRFGLPVCDKPDSVELCFVPDQDYARLVRQRRPDAFGDGEVVDEQGRVIGRHSGTPQFTIGQRRGLGIAAGVPIYVTGIDPASRRVTVGTREQLFERGLIGDGANFLINEPADVFRARVKIRYLHTAAGATVERTSDDTVRVIFDQPQPAVTPGQAVVFYDDQGYVIGGAWIREPCDPADEDALPADSIASRLSEA